MTAALRPSTAREKLTRAQLTDQRELYGDDIDLSDLFLSLNHNGVDIAAAVTDVWVERTIEGASTVTVTVADQDHSLLRSGRLSSRNDINIDGLNFRLKQVGIEVANQLDLTFEDKPIAILRTYNKPIKQSLKTSRATLTRAQFVLRMLKEVKEYGTKGIPYYIPELTKSQPIAGIKQVPDPTTKANNRSYGIPKNNDLTVKSAQMNENQRRVAETILDVGVSKVVPRAHLVMAIMCATQESTLGNPLAGKPGDFNYISKDPEGNPVGAFQQIPKYWSSRGGASRDIASDAAAFFDALAAFLKEHPGQQYQNAIEGVQHSGNASAYASWRVEAERTVTAYGVTAGDAASANSQYATNVQNADYEFYRGLPPTSRTRKQKYGGLWGKETSWDCIQRLAAEVQWRAYFVSGTFYFLAEDDLFKSQPIATINFDTDGVNDIGPADYDEGKKTASITISVEMARWAAPPGSVVSLTDMGPWNGRWLVNDVRRSLFNATGTIILKKPMPRLPEPPGGNIVKTGQQGQTWTGWSPPADSIAERQFHVGTALVQPVPKGYHPHIVQGEHQTAGLPGYPAIDFGGDAGSPVVAVESGRIVKLSGHSPDEGAVDPILGVHGPFGWSVYLLGDSGSEYYYTHLGTRSAVLNQRVAAGHALGTIGNYAAIGGVNHTHVGVKPGPDGRPDCTDLMNAPLAVN